MATILVTGSDGQLGMELRKTASSYAGYQFIFTDVSSLDIANPSDIKEFVIANKPEWIINCAAFTNVDKAEGDSQSAFSINTNGVANIIAAIKGSTCRLIHISTDYVFDGSKNTPYSETDEANPVTVYGK